jgi:hypothetical protein
MPGKDIDVSFLEDQTTYFETMGWIDPTSNLHKSYVYLYSGTEDTVVNPTTMKLLSQVYQMHPNLILSFTKTTSQQITLFLIFPLLRSTVFPLPITEILAITWVKIYFSSLF